MIEAPSRTPGEGAPVPLNVIAKPVGARCNLACRYCFYLDKQSLGGTGGRMSDEVLERFVADYIASRGGGDVHFVWQGGEPTLAGIEFYRRAVELQRRHAPPGTRVHNALQTNGVLLDDDWGRFLAEHDFLVGLSVDGPRRLTDCNRVDRHGRGAFDRIVEGAAVLDRHGVRFNVLCCVHRENSREPLATYEFLKRLGSPFLQFIPVVERRGGRVTAWSVRPADYGDFLIAIFDHWVRHDVGRWFVQLFDAQLAIRLGLPPGLCTFAEVCGNALAIERNGDVFPCDHFVEPDLVRGNVMETSFAEVLGAEPQIRFGTAKRDTLPGCCRRCRHLERCRGECPRNRFLESADGEPGLQYLCAGLERFFTHTEPHFERLAALLRADQPAARIMETFGRDGRTRRGGPGRNDACPCGSGRKFKRCCGR